jgi:acetyltransferase-like isoleucine patch superfamily enzyme
MAKNLFFDLRKLGDCGKNVIIGRTVRIRYPELVRIGDNCIIDDFTYISTALDLVEYVHIAAGCKLIGGRRCRVSMGRFSTLAPNVVLSAGSDDYRGGMATPFVPEKFKGGAEYGDIEIGPHCIVGAATVVLPRVRFGDGAAVGALSLVKKNLPAWTLFAGIPAREIGKRDKRKILAAEAAFDQDLSDNNGH